MNITPDNFVSSPDDESQLTQHLGGLQLAAQGSLAEQEAAFTPFATTPGHRGPVPTTSSDGAIDNQLG